MYKFYRYSKKGNSTLRKQYKDMKLKENMEKVPSNKTTVVARDEIVEELVCHIKGTGLKPIAI